MKNNPSCVVTCRDCHRHEHVPRSVFARRANPRCSACGGYVDPSPAAQRDLVNGMDARRTSGKNPHRFRNDERHVDAAIDVKERKA